MYKLKVWLRHYFGFTTKEARGFLLLAIFVLLLFAAPSVYDWCLPSSPDILTEVTDLKLDSLASVMKTERTTSGSATTHFFFDPNTATFEQLKALGLPGFLATRILKYRSKGGKFRRKEDFSKIYGLRPEKYKELEPYLQLPEQVSEKPEKEFREAHPAFVRPERSQISMHLADTAALKTINGVGEVLASRIIKYRDKLGGFASPDQLNEVYGLDSTVANRVKERFKITPGSIRKISINVISADSLAKHPYIGRKVAKILVNYRSQHGPFQTVADLEKSKALEAEKWTKLTPYLEF